jgi:anti-sigma factor RsiW
MTGDIVHLHGDPHEAIQALLPWYVTGRLEPADQAEVEAHLAGCAECQAELKAERRLSAEVAALPIDIEQGWATLRREIESERDGPEAAAPIVLASRRRPRGAWLVGGAIAAQLGVVAVLGVMMLTVQRPATTAQRAPQGDYHVLGARAAPTAAVGNAMVIFRPDASERALRDVLRASHARLVDGPTDTDAYVVRIPPAERAAALARLKARPEIEWVQPIDAAGSTP